MKKYIIFLFTLFISFTYVSFCHAQTASISNENKKIYCDDTAYLNILTDTFKKPVTITCEVASQEEIISLKNIADAKSKIYKITIYDKETGKSLPFARREIPFIIKTDALFTENAQIANFVGYFFDEAAQEWISGNTEILNDNLETKLIHTGYIAIFERLPAGKKYDIYSVLALTILCIGAIFVIIKSKQK